MKKLFIVIVCLSICGTVWAQEKTNTLRTGGQVAATATPENLKAGKFKFKEEVHDFGEVAEGPTAEYDFVFTNTGKEPIVISEAHGSCGCTVPQWPKEPIMPGKTGTIHVTYNTTGRPGPIAKDVYITSNAQQSPMILKIKGTVKPKAQDAAAVPTATPASAH